MRNRFDKLAKHLGEEALGASGTIVVNAEISPETQHADLRYDPDPRRKAERKRLGLLGRLASVPCLIEVYSQAPNAEEFRACLGKHIAFWQQRTRKLRTDRKQRRSPRSALVNPFLWIISAGRPSGLLAELGLEPTSKGIYHFGRDALRVGLVVASELPRNRTTLLVRLMAAGPLLVESIQDLRTLPDDAPERAVAEQILVKFQRFLEKQPHQTPTEQEFIKAMLKTWEDARAEGRAEGSTHTRAHDLLTVLQVRGIHVPAGARKRILGQRNLKQLERWFKKAIVATSLDEVLGSRA
jgi:hypothetical protein